MSDRTSTSVLARPAPRGRLTKAEAVELTAQIQKSASMLWLLVTEAHERQAWKALGYASWKAYCTTELHMSESRSYQLVDTGKAMRALSSGIKDSTALETMPTLTARQVARMKPTLPALRKQFVALVNAGERPDIALAQALKSIPAQHKAEAPRTPKPRQPSGRVTCPTCGGAGWVSAT